MKNLKNMVSAAGLMAVLVFGAVSANAQSLKGDRTKVTTEVQCTVKKDGFLKGLGSLINGLTGITIFDASCNTDEGNTDKGNTDEGILMDGYRKC